MKPALADFCLTDAKQSSTLLSMKTDLERAEDALKAAREAREVAEFRYQQAERELERIKAAARKEGK